MEISLKKLLDRREELRCERIKIDAELRSIATALEIIDPLDVGSRWPWEQGFSKRGPAVEREYLEARPFSRLSLTGTCLRILGDCGAPLNKSRVEYLATAGGYPFKATDPTNSIDVTLRRLASDGRCQVHKQGGQEGNLYSANGTGVEEDEVNNTDTRTTSD